MSILVYSISSLPLFFSLLALGSCFVFQANPELMDYRQTLLHPAYCLSLNNKNCSHNSTYDIDSLIFVIIAKKLMILTVSAIIELQCATT